MAFLGRKKLLAAYHETYIVELHPTVQDRFRALVAAVEESGYNVIITSGYRSFERQTALYKENSSNSQPGRSPHNYGLALDINLQQGLNLWRKVSSKDEWVKTGAPAIAIQMGFRWGGNFSSYHDPVHFDVLPSATAVAYMDKLYKQAQVQFGSNLSAMQGNQIRLV